MARKTKPEEAPKPTPEDLEMIRNKTIIAEDFARRRNERLVEEEEITLP